MEDESEPLSAVLRRHGFMESLNEDSIPLVAHMFSDYVALKASVAQFKSELLEIKSTTSIQQKLLIPLQKDNKMLLQENNQLRFRVAELEDFVQDLNTKEYPPQPEPFPMRQPQPMYAENMAMENELNSLRDRIRELNREKVNAEEYTQRIKGEMGKIVQDNNRLQEQLMAKRQDEKAKPSSKPTESFVESVTEAQKPLQRTAVPVQVQNQAVQSDCFDCLNCQIYQEQIQRLQQKMNEPRQENASNLFIKQVQTLSQQTIELQKIIDSKEQRLREMEAKNAQIQQQLGQEAAKNQEMENTMITAQILQQKIEQKYISQQNQVVELKGQLQLAKETQNNMQSEHQETTSQKIKTEKTLQKLVNVVEDQKMKLKMDDDVIQKLDKANQTMSEFLTKLVNENQRLKQITGEK